jgi:uncharacterized membrane protein
MKEVKPVTDEENIFGSAARRRTFLILVAAITLLLLAMLMRSSYNMLQSDMYDLSGADREDRKNALEVIGLVEDIFIALSLTVFIIGLLYGALLDPGFSDMTRLGLILAIAIILGLFMARSLW